MSDLDDYQITTPAAEPEWEDTDLGSGTQDPSLPVMPPPGDRNRLAWIVAAVVVGFALAAAAYFWFYRSSGEPTSTPEVAVPSTALPSDSAGVEEEPLEELDIPQLDTSDKVVRELVGRLSSHPALAAWLVEEDLVRRFVAAVDNIADGEIPRAHVGFLGPRSGIEVNTVGERGVIDPASFRRFDAVCAVFSSVDTAGTAKLYRRLGPLIREAYADLGYPNRDFDQTLARAIKVIRQTPRPPAEIEVVANVKSYSFADRRLESLLPVQKQLLRFGESNLGKVQAKLTALAAELQLGE